MTIFTRPPAREIEYKERNCADTIVPVLNAKIWIYFSNKIYGNNLTKQHSDTVMVWNYQDADCSLRKNIVSFIIMSTHFRFLLWWVHVCVFVCVYVCLSARVTTRPIFCTKFVCTFSPTAVARSSSGGFAKRYVLPVLRMMSHFRQRALRQRRCCGVVKELTDQERPRDFG